MWKPRHRGVIGQEQATSVFHRRGEVKRVKRLEVMGRANPCGPFADGGGHGKNPDGRIAEEGVEICKYGGVACGKRTGEAFQAGQVATAIPSPTALRRAMRFTIVGPQVGCRSTY